MKKRLVSGVLVVFAALLPAVIAAAADLIPGKTMVIKPGKLAKFISKPTGRRGGLDPGHRALATTTATAKAAFVDSAADGDTIAFCGAGPMNFNGTNTLVGKPDLPGQGSLEVAAGAALSGGGPTYDLLFSNLTPVTSPVLVAPQTACSPAPPGCPE